MGLRLIWLEFLLQQHACFFRQRAGLGPPADLLSSAGVPDHQKVSKEPAPAAPVPPAAPAGSVGTRGSTGCGYQIASL